MKKKMFILAVGSIFHILIQCTLRWMMGRRNGVTFRSSLTNIVSWFPKFECSLKRKKGRRETKKGYYIPSSCVCQDYLCVPFLLHSFLSLFILSFSSFPFGSIFFPVKWAQKRFSSSNNKQRRSVGNLRAVAASSLLVLLRSILQRTIEWTNETRTRFFSHAAARTTGCCTACEIATGFCCTNKSWHFGDTRRQHYTSIQRQYCKFFHIPYFFFNYF